MKKVIIGLALCAYSVSECMLVPFNGSQVARRESSVATEIASLNHESVVSCREEQSQPEVNFRKVSSLRADLARNIMSVMVRDCFREGEVLEARSGWYQKEYPLQKTLIQYEHDFTDGFSMPVLELYTTINDIEFGDKSGRVVFSSDFCDEEHALTHQRRGINRYEMDDANLQARQFSEIFISTESGDQVIDDAKVREDAEALIYLKLNENSWLRPDGSILNPVLLLTYSTDLAYQIKCYGNTYNHSTDEPYRSNKGCKVEIFEEWTRPDGTIFTKKTEGVEKISKPTLAAPITSSPMQIIFDLRNILHLESRLNQNLPDNVNPYKKREEATKEDVRVII